ncbi:head GIN domain-containing protein [Croceiramulus getboli]|nr:DUF2807 domain-containing protein [Flavobacteriaceae bacterium YJPT1-3]
MTTLIKFFITLLTSLLLTSCAFNLDLNRLRGNGNVITEEIKLNESFDRIEAGDGWDVYVQRGDEFKVVLEADENLVDAAEIDVRNGVLRIYADGNIASATSKRVKVTYSGNLVGLRANSGADVVALDQLKGEELDLKVSSGGSLTVDAIVRTIEVDVSSGGDIQVSGSTENLEASVSSGGMIKAKELRAKYAVANASSGGAIDVYATDRLTARASSGGDVDYWGEPKEVDAPSKSMSGGSVDKKG